MTHLYVLAAIGILGSALPFSRWTSHLPFRAPWGPYRIVIDQIGHDEDGSPLRLRIVGRRGRTLREVRAWAITNVSEVRLLGRSATELDVSLSSGGAYASFTEVYFTRRHGLRNLLVFDGGDLGVREVSDLNADGVPEIVAESPLLMDFSGYHFHRAWPVVTILGWNGERYIHVTRRYPGRSLKQAGLRRSGTLAAIRPGAEPPHFGKIEDQIAAYYANMLAAGQGAKARLWLAANLPIAKWTWFRRHERELRRLVAHPPHGPYSTRRRVIEQFLGPWRSDWAR
jgi:hypothetical protein